MNSIRLIEFFIMTNFCLWIRGDQINNSENIKKGFIGNSVSDNS